MIIWRGWGILVVLMVAVGAGVTAEVTQDNKLAMGLGLLAAATGAWFLGQWLNKTRPAGSYEAFVAHRGAELKRIVEVGAYQAPGRPSPQSYEEAHVQASQQLLGEAEHVKSSFFNRHTLFFIPMQYFGPILAIIGLFVIVTGLSQT